MQLGGLLKKRDSELWYYSGLLPWCVLYLFSCQGQAGKKLNELWKFQKSIYFIKEYVDSSGFFFIIFFKLGKKYSNYCRKVMEQ